MERFGIGDFDKKTYGGVDLPVGFLNTDYNLNTTIKAVQKEVRTMTLNFSLYYDTYLRIILLIY